MDNLARRGVCVDCMCPRCGDDPESVTHMVLGCEESKLLRKTSPLRMDIGSCTLNLNEMCEGVAKKCVEERSWEIV